MKRTLKLIPILFALVLTGCLGESQFPLGNVQEATIDQELLGTWSSIDPETGEKGTLAFYRFNAHEYVVTMASSEDGSQVAMYRAYDTTIDQNRYLNFHQLDSTHVSQPLFNFAKYEIVDGRLKLGVVMADFPEEINSTEELRTLFKQNQDNPDFFDYMPLFERENPKQTAAVDG